MAIHDIDMYHFNAGLFDTANVFAQVREIGR